MSIERYCYNCANHVQTREVSQEIPGSARTMKKLYCPSCGRDLGSVYDDELRIDHTFGVARE